MTKLTISGSVVRCGDDVNTDIVLAGEYLNLTDPVELGAHLLENHDPPVADRIVPGTILVAGRAFGGGSSREQAVLALRGRGVSAVIAESFARIFFRNALNLALPLVECPSAWRDLADADQITIDIERGLIACSDGRSWDFPLFAPFLAELLAMGGLEQWTRGRLGRAQPG